MIIENIREILKENPGTPDIFKRNMAKEYLQILTLSFLYNREEYRELIFYGGSALRHCHGLNRLSEDLDFVNAGKSADLAGIARDSRLFFSGKYSLGVETKIQKFRILMKFPVLRALGIGGPSDSDFLHLKLEIFEKFGFAGLYGVEKMPVFRFGESVVVKTFDLPTLMATKIRAVLNRKWEKTSKTGETLAVVKGRDYYDLMWYFQKGVKPNLRCIENIKDMKELKGVLGDAVMKADAKSVKYDLEALIADENLAGNIAVNIKEILLGYINGMPEE